MDMLVYAESEIRLMLEENVVNLLIVEDPISFRTLIQECQHELRGEESAFVFSKDGKPARMEKYVELILSPFSVSVSEKKIVTKLYQELQKYGMLELGEQIDHINAEIVQMLDQISAGFSIPVEFLFQMDLVGLFKLYDVRIETETKSILELLLNYIKVLSQLTSVEVLAFVNLKSFLTKEELNELYEYSFYQKIKLILFENEEKEHLSYERACIIDKDRCIINW